MIELRGVSRWFGPVLGVSRVSLTVGPGVTALLGPNGAGKSTLLRLVTGQIRPSSGSVTVFGEDPFANPGIAARWGFVPEEEGLPSGVRGRDWLQFLLRLQGLTADESSRRAEQTLARVGLQAMAERPIAAYSKGMRQRLKFAQAIAHEPDLLVLDEPLSGFDPGGRREMIDWIRRWGAKGRTVLVSSHILHDVELMTQEIVLVSEGHVLASGNVHEIRRLMDRHPHRILISTPQPKALAAQLIELEGIHTISFSEEEQEVRLETREPDHFYRSLTELVSKEGVPVEELSSPDDNLEAVFHYLVEP
jgi:ABC-2 type transport system ATP-binding protein